MHGVVLLVHLLMLSLLLHLTMSLHHISTIYSIQGVTSRPIAPFVYELKSGLEKTRFFKKTQPSGFFGCFLFFFGFFWVFWAFWVFWVFRVFLGFFGFFCPDERVFRVFFLVSRILLGASRL